MSHAFIGLNRGFVPFSLCSAFFMAAAVNFISQVMLASEARIMKGISGAFDYQRLFLGISSSSGTAAQLDSEMHFLNLDALAVLPEGYSFNGNMFPLLLLEEFYLFFIGLWLELMTTVVSLVLYRSLAVICFLDVGIVWIETSRLITMRRSIRRVKFDRFIRFLRIIEGMILFAAVIACIRILHSTGNSYNITVTVLLLIVSVFLVSLFIIGRYRLHSQLTQPVGTKNSKQDNKEDRLSSEYAYLIRTTSIIVIIASSSVAAAQLYSLISIHNFEAQIQSNNDIVSEDRQVVEVVEATEATDQITCLGGHWDLPVQRCDADIWNVSHFLLAAQILQDSQNSETKAKEK